MSAYLRDDSHVVLFRVADHYKRLKASCQKLALPAPPFTLFENGLHEVLKLRIQFDNPAPSRLIYLRPLVLGTTPHVMPVLSQEYLFTITAAPYFLSAMPDRISLKIEHQHRRTAEKGLGDAKTASNYAHQFAPTEKAKLKGYDALLWLDSGSPDRISEASSMNVFFMTKQGLFTPCLNEHLLPGLTRDSAIRIAREKLGLLVSETPIKIGDIEAWHKEGELLGMFISSTARGIRPVSRLNVSGEDVIFDVINDTTCHLIANLVQEIKEGIGDDPFDWRSVVPLCPNDTSY